MRIFIKVIKYTIKDEESFKKENINNNVYIKDFDGATNKNVININSMIQNELKKIS